MKNLELPLKGSGADAVADVWLRAVGEIGRLLGDAAESFDGISDDRVSMNRVFI